MVGSVGAHHHGCRNPLQFEGSDKDLCSLRWFPNPRARFLIGMDWRKMIWVFMGLSVESWKSCFQKFYQCTRMVIGIAFAARSDALESRTAINSVIVMGVCRQLLDDVKRLLMEEKLFDVFVEVTLLLHRCAVLKGTRGEFSYALSLKLINDETALGTVDLQKKKFEDDSMRKMLIMYQYLVKEEKSFDVKKKSFDVQYGCQGNFTTSKTCTYRIHGEFFYALDLKLTNEETALGIAIFFERA